MVYIEIPRLDSVQHPKTRRLFTWNCSGSSQGFVYKHHMMGADVNHIRGVPFMEVPALNSVLRSCHVCTCAVPSGAIFKYCVKTDVRD